MYEKAPKLTLRLVSGNIRCGKCRG